MFAGSKAMHFPLATHCPLECRGVWKHKGREKTLRKTRSSRLISSFQRLYQSGRFTEQSIFCVWPLMSHLTSLGFLSYVRKVQLQSGHLAVSWWAKKKRWVSGQNPLWKKDTMVTIKLCCKVTSRKPKQSNMELLTFRHRMIFMHLGANISTCKLGTIMCNNDLMSST